MKMEHPRLCAALGAHWQLTSCPDDCMRMTYTNEDDELVMTDRAGRTVLSFRAATRRLVTAEQYPGDGVRLDDMYTQIKDMHERACETLARAIVRARATTATRVELVRPQAYATVPEYKYVTSARCGASSSSSIRTLYWKRVAGEWKRAPLDRHDRRAPRHQHKCVIQAILQA